MKFQILTLFPEFFDSCLKVGLLNRAVKNSLIKVELIDIKKFAKKGRADDYPFGGGDGMFIGYEPLKEAIQTVKPLGKVIYLSAQGEPWSASKARSYSKKYEILTLLCGRYAGVDSRFIKDFVNEEISTGDYVLNGGEAAALVLMESLSRFLDGFLGNTESAKEESFENSLLEGPGWTKPREIKGHTLPKIIFSGHHEEIKKFRFYTSLILTWLKRPDLLKEREDLLSRLSEAEAFLINMPEEELKALGLRKKQGHLVLDGKI